MRGTKPSREGDFLTRGLRVRCYRLLNSESGLVQAPFMHSFSPAAPARIPTHTALHDR